MDIKAVGSLNNYTRTLEMQAQWNQKVRTGNVQKHYVDYNGKIVSNVNSENTSQQKEDEKLQKIKEKIYAGQKLDNAEKKYLQEKDPETWQKVHEIETEQYIYEKELHKCKTKEDVQRLRTSKLGKILANAKSIANNPNIPKEKKQEILRLQSVHENKLNSITKHFVSSKKYRDLPTDMSQGLAEREMGTVKEKIEVDADVSTDVTVSKKTGVYEPNKALVEQLKQEQIEIQKRFINSVKDMLKKQGKEVAVGEGIWKQIAKGDFEVDPKMQAEAQRNIAEDGYWGVNKTSERIISYAKALVGGDPSKIDMMEEAFKKGYKAATKSWGGELPSIAKNTYDKVMSMFDDWRKEEKNSDNSVEKVEE